MRKIVKQNTEDRRQNTEEMKVTSRPGEGGLLAWPSLPGEPVQTGGGEAALETTFGGGFDPVQPFGLVALPGFSLIELMIVVSIISLLLSILMPTLKRSRALAKQVVCQSRLRQWGIAFEVYSLENGGFYPHIDGRDRTDELSINPTVEELADYYFGWIDVLPPMMREKPWRDHKRWEYPNKETIFQCPCSKLLPREFYNQDREKLGFFSYAMNSCLELDRNCWRPYGWPSGDLSWRMPSFLNVERIRRPSRVILLFDQLLDPRLGYNGNKLNRSAGQYCGSYPRAFSARHAKSNGLLGGFILYCDYHIQWKESVWKSDWPDDLEVPPRNDPDWYPYP
jgi:prepilin-type N-terminal cleavage/methylation domain-containing protein